jgi:hypothetical protein
MTGGSRHHSYCHTGRAGASIYAQKIGALSKALGSKQLRRFHIPQELPVIISC